MNKLFAPLETIAFRIVSGCVTVVTLALATPAPAASPQLVSARHPSIAAPTGGNGGSAAPYITPDGRFVLFTSGANNLVPGQDNLFRSDVFLRDRLSNTTVMVSVNLAGNGGGNGHSVGDMLSTNGRYVLFESDATNLVAGDTNNISDIFLRDLQTGTTALVSVATGGGSGNGYSSDAVMTPDGRYVAFLSLANNLVPNDANGIQDLFVRDMLTGTTTLATPGASSQSISATVVLDRPVITPNGRYVAFFSSASGLAPTLAGGPADVYIRDLVAGTYTWASSNLTSATAYFSGEPVLSDNGRYVAYVNYTSNSNGQLSIYRFDSLVPTNVLVTTNGYASYGSLPASRYFPPYAYDAQYGPKMTPDGLFVAYVALTNISGTNYSTVHVWDGQFHADALVSRDLSGGAADGSYSDTPAITADGHYVTFLSNATNLVTNVVAGTHLYVRDLLAGTTTLADLDTNGAVMSDLIGSVPAVTADGHYLAFDAAGASQPGKNQDDLWDVFVRDLTLSSTELISAPNPALISRSANGLSSLSPLSLSTNGRWLVFTSTAEDLVTNDFNGQQDVFVNDTLLGTNVLVSVGTNGLGGLGGASGNPLISGDGRYVVFTSDATNLAPNDTNGRVNLFRRDLQTGTTVLVDVDSTGAELGTGDASAPAMSLDGRYVAFLCKTNPALSTFVTFWRDLNTGFTLLLTNNSTSLAPAMSTDGRFVTFTESLGGTRLHIWDTQLGTNIYGTGSVPTSIALSPSGAKLIFISNTQLQVINTSNGSALFVTNNGPFGFIPPPVRSPAVWSADERYFLYLHSTNQTILSGSTADVFLGDLLRHSQILISANFGATSGANASSDWPVMEGDARRIVFRGLATNILPGATNPPNLFLFDSVTGTTTLLTSESAPPPAWSAATRAPSISADGSTVAFQSLRAALSPGNLDLNRQFDVFAVAGPSSSTVDSVGDGIPDTWRAFFFGGNGTTTNSQSCATCDADGDGLSNLQEYLTGTSPVNPASALALQISTAISANSVVLTWPAIPGLTYTIQYKVQLTDTWLNAPGTLSVLGHSGNFTTSYSPGGVYYRLLAN